MKTQQEMGVVIEDFIVLLKMQRDAPNEATRLACIDSSINKLTEKLKAIQSSFTHTLKTDRDVFEESHAHHKPFEIRFNDRDYKVGDLLILKETMYSGAAISKGAPLEYTGRELKREITSIVTGYGMSDGWVVMGVKPA